MIKEVIPVEQRCEFCHIRKATKLCDFPVYNGRFVGHPPKVNGVYIYDDPYGTCDKRICNKCAIRIDNEIDFCPKCANKLKSILGGMKNNELL